MLVETCIEISLRERIATRYLWFYRLHIGETRRADSFRARKARLFSDYSRNGMESSQLSWIANFLWGIADDVLRDLYVRGKYRDVILPMTILRRLDAVLEPSKQAVDMKASLDKAKIANQDQALRNAAGNSFYNTSKFTLRDLRASTSQQSLKADFEAYLSGFSPNVEDILENFEFRNQIPRLSKADALGTLIEKFLDPAINLSPYPVNNNDGSIRQPGLDNHAMGTIFEELVRRFNEDNNEEAGQHWTPRDAVKLMARADFPACRGQRSSRVHLLYDGACGTGGMLTVAEETLQELRKTTASPSPRICMAKKLTRKPTRFAKRTFYSKARGKRRTTSSAVRNIRRCPTTPFHPANSISCCPIRPMAKAGKAISNAWAVRMVSKTRVS